MFSPAGAYPWTQGGSKMEQTFPVEQGWLTCRQTGERVELAMELPNPGRGLYRGYALGAGGRVDLGTLLPEGGRLRLRRTVSVDHLRRQGCWPVTGGRVALTYAFSGRQETKLPKGWQRHAHPEDLFPQDELLARAAKAAGPCPFFRREAGDFCLAYPWLPQRPAPLVPAICLAQVKRLDGQVYFVFHFTQAGRPMIPEGEG